METKTHLEPHTLTGLEWMTRVADGRIAAPAISRLLDFALVEVGDGLAVFEGTPSEKLYNPMGGVHGGWIATLLDSALGAAVMTKLDAATGYVTAQLGTHMTRGLTASSGKVRATGTVVHVGGRMATAEARVVDARGKLVAHGTATCVLLPRA